MLYTNAFLQKAYYILHHRNFHHYYHLDHLSLLEESSVNGPIQKDEALFMLALVKMIRPKLVIEFGFCRGHSSLNFLNALDRDAELFSYDISNESKQIAENTFKHYNNFHFLFKSQLDFAPEDISGNSIDLVYFDAIYDPNLNLLTFQKLQPLLSSDAILVLHDTGTWEKKFMADTHFKIVDGKPDNWLNEHEFQQQKGQREFCNLLMERYPDYSIFNFHSHKILRCGLTLLQKKNLLETSFSISIR